MNFKLILSLIINSSSLKIKIVRKKYFLSWNITLFSKRNTLINLICNYVISKYLMLQVKKKCKKNFDVL